MAATHRFPLLTGGAHEAALAPVALRRCGKGTESGAAPGTATNPTVPPTHLHPRDTLRSLLTPRSRLTLKVGEKTCLCCIRMPSSAFQPSPRDAWPCPCPLQPREGLPLNQVAKEVLGEGWRSGHRSFPMRKLLGGSGKRRAGGVKCPTLLSVCQQIGKKQRERESNPQAVPGRNMVTSLYLRSALGHQ